jgi:hypothetical protein
MAESEFGATSHQGRVIMTRSQDGKEKFRLEMSPGETTKAAQVVGLALSMVGLDHVPDHINYSPFVIRFFEHKTFALERTDTTGSIPFRDYEGDDLIQRINMGRDICLNEQTHGKAIPSNVPPNPHMACDEPL